MTLRQKGLIVLVFGIVLNAVLMSLGVHGLIAELARILILVGFVIFVFGFLAKK